MSQKLLPCPKCKAETGDAWDNCEGSCPMPMSPHYTPAPEGEAVAWRVKDYADGWILFHHEAPARASGEARNGALVQPLYASPVVPVGVSREEIAKTLFERHWSAVSASPKWPGDDDGSYWLWLADAIIAALRPTDTGANHD